MDDRDLTPPTHHPVTIRGASPTTSSINVSSASFKAKTKVRCCPWDPYCRAGVALMINSTSSRWGTHERHPLVVFRDRLGFNLVQKCPIKLLGLGKVVGDIGQIMNVQLFVMATDLLVPGLGQWR